MKSESVSYSLEDFKEFKEKTPAKTRQEYMKPINSYTLEGAFLETFDSAEEAGKKYGLSAGAIQNICAGRHLYSRKIKKIFLYRGDDILKRVQKIDYHPLPFGQKKVYEYTLGGRLLGTWPSINIAAKSVGVSPMTLTSRLYSPKGFIGKRIFLFPTQDIKERVKNVKAELYRLSKKRPKYREVDMYSLKGEFLKAFPSASAASREVGIHVSSITRCCKGVDGCNRSYYTIKDKIFLWVGDSISERLEIIKEKTKSKKQ